MKRNPNPAEKATYELPKHIEATSKLMDQLGIKRRAFSEGEDRITIVPNGSVDPMGAQFSPRDVKFSDGKIVGFVQPKICLFPQNIEILIAAPLPPAHREFEVYIRSLIAHELTHYMQVMTEADWKSVQNVAADPKNVDAFDPQEYVNNEMETQAFAVQGAYFFSNFDTALAPEQFGIEEWRDKIICAANTNFASAAGIDCTLQSRPCKNCPKKG